MLTATFFTLVALAAPQTAGDKDAPIQADVVLRGATLVDGTGKPGRVGDLAIRGDRIVAVGTFTVAGKPRVLDATGLVIAPGFIDLHTHSDTALTEKATSANLNYLMQGVTTAVTGNSWPLSVWISLPEAASQILMTRSAPADAICLLSGLNTADQT